MVESKCEKGEDAIIVKLAGRLDVKTAVDADSAFGQAAGEEDNVILDLTDLDYIASAGLRAIKRLRGLVRDNGGELLVRGTQEDVMEVFDMTGFTALLTFE